MACKHPNMQFTARLDHCPDCGYEFYYGDAHAIGEAQISRLVNPGNQKMTASKSRERAKQVIVEIIRQMGEQLITKQRLNNIFYQAHIIYADEQASYLSTWPIIKSPTGPAIDNLDVLIGELLTENVLKYDNNFHLRLTNQQPRSYLILGSEVLDVINQAVYKMDYIVDSRSWREAKDGQELNIYIDSISEEEYQKRNNEMTKIMQAALEYAKENYSSNLSNQEFFASLKQFLAQEPDDE